MHQITYPTKEQVRAYMHQRVSADRPPSTPAEIRLQLGWSCTNQLGESASQSDSAPEGQELFIMGNIGQLGALLALAWLFRATGFSRSG